MAADEKILFLLDGMALVYRGHFGLIRNPRMTSEGMNTSAVFAFANTLLSIVNKGQPTHLAAVFDTPEPTSRHKRFPAYKAQREAMETLNERQRMALLLNKFEHMSYADIAESMDLTVQAVKSLLTRARENLRTKLEPYL